MSSEKFKSLLVRLSVATKTGKVRWEETAREGVFRIALGEGLIRLERGDGDDPFLVAYLLDSRGQVIDEVMAREVTGGTMFKVLADLYQCARQSVYKDVDDVVDTMHADLNAKIA